MTQIVPLFVPQFVQEKGWNRCEHSCYPRRGFRVANNEMFTSWTRNDQISCCFYTCSCTRTLITDTSNHCLDHHVMRIKAKEVVRTKCGHSAGNKQPRTLISIREPRTQWLWYPADLILRGNSWKWHLFLREKSSVFIYNRGNPYESGTKCTCG